MFDAAAGFGGYRESGFGREGGKEGLYEYVKPSKPIKSQLLIQLLINLYRIEAML